jgi:hypothetical protein
LAESWHVLCIRTGQIPKKTLFVPALTGTEGGDYLNSGRGWHAMDILDRCYQAQTTENPAFEAAHLKKRGGDSPARIPRLLGVNLQAACLDYIIHPANWRGKNHQRQGCVSRLGQLNSRVNSLGRPVRLFSKLKYTPTAGPRLAQSRVIRASRSKVRAPTQNNAPSTTQRPRPSSSVSPRLKYIAPTLCAITRATSGITTSPPA